MPIAESRPPIVVGIRQTSSAISTVTLWCEPRVDRERRQRRDGDHEDDRQPGEQDREGDFVGRLLPLRAFDEGDHAVEKAFARIRGNAHDDAVGEHARSAGDRAAVAAGFANDRRRFAGNGGLVDRRRTFEHVAVGGNDFIRLRR